MSEFVAKENKGIFIDIDALYDTRLATLEALDERLAYLALTTGYEIRDEDVFPFVDKELFQELYSSRDEDILAKALPTKIIEIIKNFLAVSLQENINSPWVAKTEVYLNIYPYKLDKTVANEMAQALFKLCSEKVNVHVVNFPNERVTPQFLKEKIALVIKYEYADWLEVHSKTGAFRSCQMPDVSLYVPPLFFAKKPPPDVIIEHNRTGPGIFKSIEIGAASIIGLEFIGIDFYNAVLPDGFIEDAKKRYNAA